MEIKKAELEVIAVRRSQYPDKVRPEFLLVGRSNVGKSSFINALLSRKNLAHISSRPGKTKTLNFYSVNDSFYLVDAPGYGYAQVDRKTQSKFGMMIEEYIETRKQMKRVFMLVDFRHKPSEDDVLMYNFLKYYKVPVTIIATKVDKIGKTKRDKNLNVIKNTLELVVGDDIIMVSNSTKLGIKEVLDKIESLTTVETL